MLKLASPDVKEVAKGVGVSCRRLNVYHPSTIMGVQPVVARAGPAERGRYGQRQTLVQDLDRRLKLWRQEQLAYYADASRQRREYAPVIND